MRAVKAGEEVILTERGKPVAVIKPLDGVDHAKAAIRRLEAAGFMRAATKRHPLPGWRPRRLRGAPLSKTLREERDES